MGLASRFEDQIADQLPRLRRFAHALSCNSSDADDLAQGAIERALRAKRQWRSGTRLDSWLFKITRNLWIDTIRTRSRRETVEVAAEEAYGVIEDPMPQIEASLELKRVMSAMDRIPNDQREVVALILIEGFGYRETSDMLGLPIGTVASRLARGRTALLQLLGEQ